MKAGNLCHIGFDGLSHRSIPEPCPELAKDVEGHRTNPTVSVIIIANL